ncbi:MAG: 50S ribosomal protein L9 [Legionellaceae bacterium]
MQVILLENFRKLGQLGQTVKVKPGFARNFLIPQQKAVPATKANLQKFETQRAELEAVAEKNLNMAKNKVAELANLTVTIPARAGEEGKLFGSIGAQDIAKAVTAAGVEISKNHVRLNEGPLRNTGEFDIALHLHNDVNATVKIIIVSESA